jgi:biotin carboxyl carrier protein
VLESMKMELVLAAPLDGTVTELTVAVGDRVAVDQPLARVEAAA